MVIVSMTISIITVFLVYDVVITTMTFGHYNNDPGGHCTNDRLSLYQRPVVIVPIIAPVIVTITGGHCSNDRLSLYQSLLQ